MIKAMKQTLGEMKEHREIVKKICRQRCEKFYDLCDSQKESSNYEIFKKYYKNRIRSLEMIEMFHDVDLYLPNRVYRMAKFSKYEKYMDSEQLLSQNEELQNIKDKYYKMLAKHYVKLSRKYAKKLSTYDFIVELAIDLEANAIKENIPKEEYYLKYVCPYIDIMIPHDKKFLLEVELEVIPMCRNLSFDTIEEIKKKFPNQLKDEIGEKLFNMIP